MQIQKQETTWSLKDTEEAGVTGIQRGVGAGGVAGDTSRRWIVKSLGNHVKF